MKLQLVVVNLAQASFPHWSAALVVPPPLGEPLHRGSR